MKRFKFTIHNLFGHPIMELLNIFGFHKAAMWVHDSTLPKNWQNEYNNSWDVGE